MKKRIDVKAEHINHGERQEPDSCAVAMACFEAKITAPQVYDSPDGEGLVLEYGPCDVRKTVALPSEVADFIRRFDNFDQVKPISFELELDDPEGA